MPLNFTTLDAQGYLPLGPIISGDPLLALQTRIDDIMMGRIRYPGMFFQRDPGAGYGAPEGPAEYAGPSREYRKIKDLEYDDLCLDLIQSEVFNQLSERYIGPDVSCMRAMCMNKPARIGSDLPYHQDVSEQWAMSIPPVFTVWMAIDAATRQNGCLEIVPGSHKHGRIGHGHMITTEEEAEHAPPGSSIFVELEPGHAIVFHNALLHRSGPNRSDRSRRALTVCLMDAACRHTRTGKSYPVIFGRGALTVAGVRRMKQIPDHVYE